MSNRQHVLVVGAGIIGALIALRLLRAGAQVTVLEGNDPGGTATRNSFAWINASWGNPRDYFRFRVNAIDEWHELERSLPNLRVSWSGSLNWGLSRDQLQRFATENASWGFNTRTVGPEEASALEPSLADPPHLAMYAPAEGAVEPLNATRAILAAVIRLGGIVVANNPARALDMRNGRVCGIRTDTDYLAADEIVVAAGAGAAPLLSTVGFSLPVRVLPSLLITSRPHPKLLNGLIMTPAVQIRQNPEGRVIACAGLDHGIRPDETVNAALALHEAVRGTVKSGKLLILERYAVGDRPIPADGLPLLGRIGSIAGLYIAVTHSGITLAPTIGRLVAEEIVTLRQDPLLKPYSVNRLRPRVD